MSSSLGPLMAVVLAGDILLVVAFLRLAQQRDLSALRLWALSFGFGALRYSAGLLNEVFGPMSVTPAVIMIGASFSAAALLDGTLRLIGRRHTRAVFGVAGVLSLWVLVAGGMKLSFMVVAIPTFLTLGLANIVAGVVVVRTKVLPTGQRTFAAAALILWGLHRLNYPFLRDVEWFAPWGFSLAAILELSVGVTFVLGIYDRTQRDLVDTSERFRVFYEDSPVGFFRSRHEGGFIEANPTLVKILGYETESEVLTLSVADLYLNPDDRAAFQARENGDRTRGEIFRWKKKDGTAIVVALHGNGVRSDDGQLQYYEGFVRDVSSEHALDEALQHAQKIEMLGHLAGGIAHDFNNLLTVIHGSVDLLQEGESFTGDDRELLDEISHATEQARGLTGQMLTLARKKPVQTSVVNVADLLRKSRPMMARLFKSPCVLRVLVEGDVMVRANAGQLEQVVLNLVLNAKDAIGRAGTVSVTLKKNDGKAVLVVTDDGCGIPADVLPHLFEPFFTTKEPGKGTGLGLAVVYSVVTQSHGEISTTSKVGGGTTFRIELPLATNVAHPADLSPHDGSVHVLLVDDDPAVLRLLRRGLESRGVIVTAASSGLEALSFIDGPHKPTVVVSDISMPEISGVELLNEIRLRDRDLPVILMTGYARHAFSKGVHENVVVLEKPFPLDTLLAALALDGRSPTTVTMPAKSTSPTGRD